MDENQADKEQQPEVEIVEDQLNEAQPVEAEDEQDQDELENEVVVSIGEEAPPTEEEKPAPKWVRELRRTQRELQRENRELKAKLETTARTETKPVQVGVKPTLDSCDYDSEKFEVELAQWYERKREADAAEAQVRSEQEAQERAWKSKLEAYGKAKAELRVRDYDDAEEAVQQFLDVTQQGVLIEGADNPALLVYALGKNPAKAKELAAIKSPVKFAFAVAKLEKELKVSNRSKQAPPPERTVSGTGRISGAVDSTLERLRAEADRTGDRTKVVQYMKQQRSKQ
jgi:hypothetical protein